MQSSYRREYYSGDYSTSSVAATLRKMWKSAKSRREDSRNEVIMVLERRVNDCKTGTEILLEGRKAEMEEMMNHHVFDENHESDAVRKKLIRAKRLNDNRVKKGSTTRLGFHDIRVAFFHAPVEEEIYVRCHVALLRLALCGTRQTSLLLQKAGVRALKELGFVHLDVAPCI